MEIMISFSPTEDAQIMRTFEYTLGRTLSSEEVAERTQDICHRAMLVHCALKGPRDQSRITGNIFIAEPKAWELPQYGEDIPRDTYQCYNCYKPFEETFIHRRWLVHDAYRHDEIWICDLCERASRLQIQAIPERAPKGRRRKA